MEKIDVFLNDVVENGRAPHPLPQGCKENKTIQGSVLFCKTLQHC